ncbi:probable cyclic nucleotide-gated ion channel 20, chloroplastic [Rosa rugosa]|uniref:probable cyclic nucleotide-gated ion channel 20, chloroplastic n=1 Tax=Rosa rugosa TaxID=74645 RepID=UPI002B409C96|nr:probable cyclic nucleotide-gated ion channel 20, chloroplastic [Rosa rugosa]
MMKQISTLAGNQTPSHFVWEVVFTMAIIGLGLLLFALLIGNMHNFLQALGRRRLEMSLRRRDVEQWMSHRRLPDELGRLFHKQYALDMDLLWVPTNMVSLGLLQKDSSTESLRHHWLTFREMRRMLTDLGAKKWK